MADLSTLFNNLGPAGGSILAGVQMGNEANAQQAEQAYRQAQMDSIMQATAHAQEMAPLEVKAKQQAIDEAQLKQQQEHEAYRNDVMGKVIPDLENTPAPLRHARMEQAFTQAGLPLDDADRQHLYSLDPQQLVDELKHKHEWAVTQDTRYRAEMDKQALHNKGMIEAAKIAAQSREDIAKNRLQSAEQQAMSMKKASDRQAHFTTLAMQAEFDGNIIDANRYKKLAEAMKEQVAAETADKSKVAREKQEQSAAILAQALGQGTPAPAPKAKGTADDPIVLK